jgi:hypothetical protein
MEGLLMESQKRKVRLLDPTASSNIEKVILANRLSTLDNNTIGLLDNSKANTDVFLARLQELLAEKFKIVRFFKFRKQTPARGVPTSIMDELARCDAVINGIAD